MTSNDATLSAATQDNNKKRILNASEYRDLCEFINNYHGLAIDCEMELQDKFPQIQRLTLKAILQIELTNRMRSEYWRYDANAKKYLKR